MDLVDVEVVEVPLAITVAIGVRGTRRYGEGAGRGEGNGGGTGQDTPDSAAASLPDLPAAWFELVFSRCLVPSGVLSRVSLS